MITKVEVKKDTCHPNRKIIFTDNCVTEKLVETITDILEEDKEVAVSFNVMGETLHTILSNQLKLELRDRFLNKYKVDIGRYKCIVSGV